MAISAIVSNFNGLKFLPRLIESLRDQKNVELEIIIVDRMSSDGSREFLESTPGIIVTTEPPESGLVAGYDCGARIAKNNNLFFCNEDMWFDSDCLSLLEQTIDLNRQIVAADPWQWSYDGSELIHANTVYVKNRFSVNSPHPFISPDFLSKTDEKTVVPFPCAGAFMMDKGKYNRVGGWDRSFFLNHEDLDLFIRVWQQGGKCVGVPQAKVYHACGASNHKIIQGGKVRVGKKRYISNFASILIVGIKYFSLPTIILALFSTLIRIANNACRFRLEFLKWDYFSLIEILKRCPEALRFRRQNSKWNQLKPGQRYFFEWNL